MTKIEAARDEYRNWCTAVGVCTLDDLNALLEEGRGSREGIHREVRGPGDGTEPGIRRL